MSNRKEKTVSFHSDTMSTTDRSRNSGYGTGSYNNPDTYNGYSTPMDSTTSSMNRGYSTENLYWGVHTDDVDRVRTRMG